MTAATVHGGPSFRDWQTGHASRHNHAARLYRITWRWMGRDLQPTIDRVLSVVREIAAAFAKLPPNVIDALLAESPPPPQARPPRNEGPTR